MRGNKQQSNNKIDSKYIRWLWEVEKTKNIGLILVVINVSVEWVLDIVFYFLDSNGIFLALNLGLKLKLSPNIYVT